MARLYWGWVVCLSFLTLNILGTGIGISFGELVIPISKEVNVPMSLLNWVGTLAPSISVIGTPLGTWLYYKFGARILLVIGVIVMSLSLLLVAFTHNVIVSLTFFGILGGFGTLLIFNPPFFLMNDYFPYRHPRHVLATGLVVCSLPIATLIFNPLTYALIESVGWRAAYGIFTAPMLVFGLVAAATFRSPTGSEVEDELAGGFSRLSSKTDNFTDFGTISIPRTEDNTEELRRAEYNEICNRSIQTIIDQQPQDEQTNGEQQSEMLPSGDDIPTVTKILMSSLWLTASLLKCLGFYIPPFILVKQMDLLGIPQWQASRAMAITGACELVSRFGTSFLGDRVKGRMLYVYVVCSLLLCIQNALGSLAYTYTHFLLYAAGIGMFGGPIIASIFSTCSEVMGSEHLATLFSIFRVSQGLAILIGPSLAGGVFDITGSFRDVFYFNSAMYLMASMLYLTISLINTKRPSFLYQTNQTVR